MIQRATGLLVWYLLRLVELTALGLAVVSLQAISASDSGAWEVYCDQALLVDWDWHSECLRSGSTAA